MPYIRDTRRSIGLDGFILKVSDLGGDPANLTGKRFRDRVALGAYGADIHPVTTCAFPGYVNAGHETLPFCIPFRSLDQRAIRQPPRRRQDDGPELPGQLGHPTPPDRVVDRHRRRRRRRRHEQERLDRPPGVRAHRRDAGPRPRRKTPIDWTINGETYPEPEGEETPL